MKHNSSLFFEQIGLFFFLYVMNTALATEKLLQESDNRFVLFPDKTRCHLGDVQKHLAAHWVTEEVILSQDIVDWNQN